MAADFSIGWDFGGIGGALWLRHKVVSGGPQSGTWLPPDAFALDVRLDGRVWLELLAPGLRATVNGEPLDGPRRLRLADHVVISDGQRSQRLTLRGLRADDTVPPGVLHVEGDAPPAVASRGATAAGMLEQLGRPAPIFRLAERWRVRGLQRAAAWLTAQGVAEAADIATSPRRPVVERAVTALLAADPPRVTWADALAAFLGPEGRVLSEGLSISVSASGPNAFVDPGPGPELLAAALEHVALIARDVLRWLSALDPALAAAEAADMEADAAVSSDDAQDEAQSLSRLLAPEGALTHRGSLVAPPTDGEWSSEVEVIEGDLVLTRARVRSVAFPALKAVRGAIVVDECLRLVDLYLPALVAAGSLKVHANPLLVALDLPAFQAAEGDVEISGNRFLLRLSLPALERARTVRILYDDALPRSEVTPLLERLGPGMVVHRENPDTPRDPLRALLGGAWVRAEERAKLRLVAPWFPEHPEVAELALFDALLTGIEGEALETPLARVITLCAGQRAELSARLLRQALRGVRPLGAERQRLADVTPAPTPERRWAALVPRLLESPRCARLLDGFLQRAFGVHLVDALPETAAAVGAWLEARVATDHEPLDFVTRLMRSVGALESFAQLTRLPFSDANSLGSQFAGWAQRAGRPEAFAREVALLELELASQGEPVDAPESASSLFATWNTHQARREAEAAAAQATRDAQAARHLEPALDVAASALEPTRLASLRALVLGPLVPPSDRGRVASAEFRQLAGVAWFIVRFDRMAPRYAGWDGERFVPILIDELLAQALPDPSTVQAVYVSLSGSLPGTREAVEALVREHPSMQPALDAWRPPWADDAGVHFFVTGPALVLQLRLASDGRLFFTHQWMPPMPPGRQHVRL